MNTTYTSETVELDYCPLHAAAPRMLAELKDIVNTLDSGYVVNLGEARAVLKDLEGESNV